METNEAGHCVKIAAFEGPLDLLLHLIKKNEVNIYDIPIALITQQYIEALELRQTLNLSIAGDYLVMAATLLYIKSKTLLPSSGEMETVEEEDPRLELVARLLEYQSFKEVARFMEAREAHWQDVFGRESTPVDLPPDEIGLSEVTPYDLLDALKKVMARLPNPQLLHITVEELSVKDQVQLILQQMEIHPSILFEQLFEGACTRHRVVTTFLALLEVIRLGRIRVIQVERGGALRIWKMDLRADGGEDGTE